MKYWLIVLSVLAILSWFPSIGPFASLPFVLLGLFLIASNTVLYYLVTVAFARSQAWRFANSKWVVIGPAVAIAAVIPALVGRSLLYAFAAGETASDFTKPATLKPRSFALPLSWGGWLRAESSQPSSTSGEGEARPLCAELCQRLLYGNLAEAVFVTIAEDMERGPNGGWLRPKTTWRFRVAQVGHNSPCPKVLGGLIHQFRDKPSEGVCLIAERVDEPDADVIFAGAKSKVQTRGKCSCAAPLRPWTFKGPVRTVVIKERSASGWEPVERRTEIDARVPPFPFYVWPVPCGRLKSKLALAIRPVHINPIDPAEILKRRYGLILPEPVRQASRRQQHERFARGSAMQKARYTTHPGQAMLAP